MKLKKQCSVCNSWSWCGRQGGNAPKTLPPISADPPPHRPYKNGKSYSPKTGLYGHECSWCGAEFTGSLDKTFCSDACRVNAWRAKKRDAKSQHIGQRLLIGWSQVRFAVLERDGFKCRYCGRGAKQNAVLHVDHVKPVAAGGSHDMAKLVAACQECNLGKGSALISRVPD